jgi:hypothetical protein
VDQTKGSNCKLSRELSSPSRRKLRLPHQCNSFFKGGYDLHCTKETCMQGLMCEGSMSRNLAEVLVQTLVILSDKLQSPQAQQVIHISPAV